MEKISKALLLATKYHQHQQRKGKVKVPYIVHPIEVFDLLVKAGIADENILIGGILHDVIEDTNCTKEDIKKEFSEKIVKIIMEVSCDKSLPADVRKKLQVTKTVFLSNEAKLIKIADKISNLKTFIDKNDEPTWRKEVIDGYIIWSYEVVEPILDINCYLKDEYIKIHNYLLKKYNINMNNRKEILDNYYNLMKKGIR